MYKWAGRLIAVSICNGGEAGNSLAECLYNLIAIGEHACNPTVSDVPDTDVRNTLEQVRSNQEDKRDTAHSNTCTVCTVSKGQLLFLCTCIIKVQ